MYVTYNHSLIHSYSCLCVSGTPFSVKCAHLAVLGTIGGGLASGAHEWLLQHLAAVITQRGIAVAVGSCVLRPWHLVSWAPPVLTGN